MHRFITLYVLVLCVSTSTFAQNPEYVTKDKNGNVVVNTTVLNATGVSTPSVVVDPYMSGGVVPQTGLLQWLDFRRINLLGGQWDASTKAGTALNGLTFAAAAGPTGAMDAIKITEDSTNAEHYWAQILLAPAGYTQFTLSASCTTASARNLAIGFTDTSSGGIRIFVNPSTGAVVSGPATFGAAVFSAGVGGAYPDGAGWTRIWITATRGTSVNLQVSFYLASTTTTSYAGDGASGVTCRDISLVNGATISPVGMVPAGNVTGVVDLSGKGNDATLVDSARQTLAGTVFASGHVSGLVATPTTWTVINSDPGHCYGADSASGSYVDGAAQSGALTFALASAYTGTVASRLAYSRILTSAEHAAVCNYVMRNISIPNPIYAVLLESAQKVLAQEHITFSSDATDGWNAGATWGLVYIADIYYAMKGCPSCFSDAQVRNIIDKFVALKNVNGLFPTNTTGVPAAGAYAAADGEWFLPQLEWLYWRRTGSTAGFATNAAAYKTAITYLLSGTNRNSSTHLPKITVSGDWSPWGFHDQLGSTGDVLDASVLYFETAVKLAEMYAAVGNASDAAYFTAEAAVIKANISTLYDSNTGMFFAATTLNHQVDVLMSAKAVDVGLTTSAQASRIGAYLVANRGTLAKAGFYKQTVGDWSACSSATGNTDNGFWTVHNAEIATAMALANPAAAVDYIRQLATGTYIYATQEWLGASANGSQYNIESPMGNLVFIRSHPEWFPATSVRVP